MAFLLWRYYAQTAFKKMNDSANDTAALIKQLEEMIKGGNAHAPLHDAIAGIPADKTGIVPDGLPYSIWQLLYHIRIASWDILEFSKDRHHKSPKWPDEYWPKETAPASQEEWNKTVQQIHDDQQEFIKLLHAADDLYKPFPHGDGQSLLREALLIASHNSYHTAEIIVIRRLLGIWKNIQ